MRNETYIINNKVQRRLTLGLEQVINNKIITSALKCVSLAAQKLRRMFIVIPGYKEPRGNAIFNAITSNNPKVITSQPAKY